MEETPRYRIRTLYEVDERLEEMERAHRLEIEALKAGFELKFDLLERSFKALVREILGE